MERRPFFVLGDLAANTVTGVVVAWATAALVGAGWNMFVGMWVGMALGMVLAFVLSFAAFIWFLGAMEVMLPVMFTGMAAGMVVGMGIPMNSFAETSLAAVGASTGIAVFVFTYVIDALLGGKVKKWTT